MSNYRGLCYGLKLHVDENTPPALVYWPLEFDSGPHDAGYFAPKRVDDPVIITEDQKSHSSYYLYNGEKFVQIVDMDKAGYEKALVTGVIESVTQKRKEVSLLCQLSGIVTLTIDFGHVFYDTKPLDKVDYAPGGSFTANDRGGIVCNDRIEKELQNLLNMDLGWPGHQARFGRLFPKTM